MAIKFDGEHMLITFTYLDIDASRHRHEMTLASGRKITSHFDPFCPQIIQQKWPRQEP